VVAVAGGGELTHPAVAIYEFVDTANECPLGCSKKGKTRVPEPFHHTGGCQ